MEITRRFGRIGAVLLPVALLAVFFKYLHPLNAILHGIEGWGARKIAFTLFISFFSIWSLLHVSSLLFARIAGWVWNGTSSNLRENISYSENKNREELFKVDLRDENAA